MNRGIDLNSVRETSHVAGQSPVQHPADERLGERVVLLPPGLEAAEIAHPDPNPTNLVSLCFWYSSANLTFLQTFHLGL